MGGGVQRRQKTGKHLPAMPSQCKPGRERTEVFWSLYSCLMVKGVSRAQAGLAGDHGGFPIQGRCLEPESSHMCLASSDSLFLCCALTTSSLPSWGPMQGVSQHLYPTCPSCARTIPPGKIRQRCTDLIWVCVSVFGEHFQGTGSYDGVPGWEESLRPSKHCDFRRRKH